jgi:hypothetical protein
MSQARDDLQTRFSCIIRGSEVCFLSEGFEIRGWEACHFRRGELTINFTMAQTNAWPLLDQWMCLGM